MHELIELYSQMRRNIISFSKYPYKVIFTHYLGWLAYCLEYPKYLVKLHILRFQTHVNHLLTKYDITKITIQ